MLCGETQRCTLSYRKSGEKENNPFLRIGIEATTVAIYSRNATALRQTIYLYRVFKLFHANNNKLCCYKI